MTVNNFQYTQGRALDADKKVVSAAYTVRTGSTSDRFKFDNPVVFTDPADDVTVTLGSGSYIGQFQYFVMNSNTNSKTVTLSVTNHETSDPETFAFDAADEALMLVWNGTEWHTVQSSGVTAT